VALNLTQTYRLATNDFLAAGGDQYSMFAGRPMVGRGGGLHEALELAFREAVGPIVVPTDVRLTIIGGE
jgi:2',3'-cyclic-nucleotide 2'-phosphodiesterase (5'-nucleotidase family)